MSNGIKISQKFILFLVPLCIFSNQLLFSQCTNGTQPECTCETAPVLCTVDELDGYVFSMASFMHPQDGPTPICSSANMSQTNNPTWFAFTAWCSDLTLRARPTNCQQVLGVVGVQIAIYEDCTFSNEVACDVDIQDCNTGTKVLAMTGLTIGGVYYFMVDGCLGSYCTVTIDVVGVCGEEEIAPWTLPVIGDTHPCTGDSETYTVQNLNGAVLYHWFLDGALVSQSPSTSFNTVWNNPGSYQLCIDASHDPCVPITDDPSPLCVNIVVHEAEAGILNVSPSPLCLNEIATLSSGGYSPGADNTQIILITDASGIIVQVIQAASGIFTSGTGGTFTVYAYNYIPSVGTVPGIGTNISDIDCNSECCDLVSQTITFQGIDAAVSNIICDDNGTDDDPADDTFTFDLLVTGQTPGTLWQSTDGTLDGTYGTILNCGPYLIDGGSLSFDLHDLDVPACVTSITVAPPSACSVCLQMIDAGPGSTINCMNTTAILSGSSSAPGTYTWTGPGAFFSNSLTTIVIDSGWYYLTIDFANQCTFTDSVYIDLDTDPPLVDAGPGSTINCIDTSATLNGTTSGAGTYFWTGPGSFISKALTITVIDSGWYYLNAEFANQCTNMDSAFVGLDIDAPVANAGPDEILDCNQPEVFIVGSSSSGNNLQYEWTNASGVVISTQSGLLVSIADIYTLELTNAINGCVSIDDVEVTIDPNRPAEIIANVIPENCYGQNNGVIEVTGVSGGTPPYTYVLNGLVTDSTGFFNDLARGDYSLQITDGQGCTLDTFFTIQQGLDLQLELPPLIELIIGQSGFIEANVNVATDELTSIQWNPPGFLTCDTCLITTIDALGNYSFQLTVVHQNGCVATAELNITVVPETEIYIPNVFSPNGDGYNDYFTLYANERVDKILELNVFDRWGDLVFHRQQFNPNDESAGWDGRFKGKEMMSSLFVYFIEVLLADGTTEVLSGDVTLLR